MFGSGIRNEKMFESGSVIRDKIFRTRNTVGSSVF
jgi:hypothetical protein